MPTKSVVQQYTAKEPRFFHSVKKYSSIFPSTACVFLSFSWTFRFLEPTSCQTEIVLKKPGGKINFPLFLAHNGALIKIWLEIVEPLASWHHLWNLCTFWNIFTLSAKPIKSHCESLKDHHKDIQCMEEPSVLDVYAHTVHLIPFVFKISFNYNFLTTNIF